MKLSDLAGRIAPESTVLLFGAGASSPSGAPCGLQLTQKLCAKFGIDSDSFSLQEIAEIIEELHSRRELVDHVSKLLSPLEPDGGICSVPEFPWKGLYTTNFDDLIEKSYRKHGIPLHTTYDAYTSPPSNWNHAVLNKIHGSIGIDESTGYRSRMVLSESDYRSAAEYRRGIFSRLIADLYESDVLIIGHSLTDTHLKEIIKQVCDDSARLGVGNKVYVLCYEQDDNRKLLIEKRGAMVVFGGIDELMDAIASSHKISTEPLESKTKEFALQPSVASTVWQISSQAKRDPDVSRMAGGSAATYSDIEEGLTFERNDELTLQQHVTAGLENGGGFGVIKGYSGAGKTTLARRILLHMYRSGIDHVYEHNDSFVFSEGKWFETLRNQSDIGMKIVLLVDDVQGGLFSFAKLLQEAEDHHISLYILCTTETRNWVHMVKPPKLIEEVFSIRKELLGLNRVEVQRLVHLVERSEALGRFVSPEVKRSTHNSKVRYIEKKCGKDMFVALRYLFSSSSIDDIIIQEFEHLDQLCRDVYMTLAHLEVLGASVHRQLLIRMLGIDAMRLSGLMSQLSGVVFEELVSPKNGIFSWSTRHKVIARIIYNYKFPADSERYDLLKRIIRNVSPFLDIEKQTIRNICYEEEGIPSVHNIAWKKELLETLIGVAPRERAPHRVYTRLLISSNNLAAAEFAIRDSRAIFGNDGPINRYEVKLYIARASVALESSGVGHCSSLLDNAWTLAKGLCDDRYVDKYAFYQLIDVSRSRAKLLNDYSTHAEAYDLAKVAAQHISDRDFPAKIEEFFLEVPPASLQSGSLE